MQYIIFYYWTNSRIPKVPSSVFNKKLKIWFFTTLIVLEVILLLFLVNLVLLVFFLLKSGVFGYLLCPPKKGDVVWKNASFGIWKKNLTTLSLKVDVVLVDGPPRGADLDALASPAVLRFVLFFFTRTAALTKISDRLRGPLASLSEILREWPLGLLWKLP